MGDVLEKLGIYDLIAVLLTGITISTFSILIMKYIYNFDISTIQDEEMFTFFVISYFVGTIFQEIGSYFGSKFSNWFLKLSLKENIFSNQSLTSNQPLTQGEINRIKDYVKHKLSQNQNSSIPNNIDDKTMYEYCKFYLIKEEKTVKIDKDQSLAAMSRSVVIYFLLVLIVSLFVLIVEKNIMIISLILFCIGVVILFFRRWLRFNIVRRRYIFRCFYYSVNNRSSSTSPSSTSPSSTSSSSTSSNVVSHQP
ncbi:MAG: hypothetical protein U0L18_05025 [Acutalibacteraceae bacterium]|nr:hypothetical protein [Acutalibacteraceae bacterium]